MRGDPSKSVSNLASPPHGGFVEQDASGPSPRKPSRDGDSRGITSASLLLWLLIL
jgi:hypothetical protein